jgi:hypothetical protein
MSVTTTKTATAVVRAFHNRGSGAVWLLRADGSTTALSDAVTDLDAVAGLLTAAGLLRTGDWLIEYGRVRSAAVASVPASDVSVYDVDCPLMCGRPSTLTIGGYGDPVMVYPCDGCAAQGGTPIVTTVGRAEEFMRPVVATSVRHRAGLVTFAG